MQFRSRSFLFTVSEPYAQGHQLTAGEAQALNQLRADKLREATARMIDKFGSTQLHLSRVRSQLAALDSTFIFREAPSSAPRSDPFETEVYVVAKERAEQMIRQDGGRQSDLDDLISELSPLPHVHEEARRRLSERKRVASASLSELFS